MGLRPVYESLAHFIWGTPNMDRDGNVVQIERALSAIRGFSILGLFPVMVVGGLAGYCAGGCDASDATSSIWRGIGVALLAGISSFATGALLGFLFGLPRWSDAPAMVPQAE